MMVENLHFTCPLHMPIFREPNGTLRICYKEQDLRNNESDYKIT